MKLIPLFLLFIAFGFNSEISPISQEAQEKPVKLSELFAEPEQYEGKTIRVSGTCVKVNNDIMGKNWVHIQDDSGDDFDLTITTQETVKVDSIITFEGVIKTNVDLGAGYFYKVIMEHAKLVKAN